MKKKIFVFSLLLGLASGVALAQAPQEYVQRASARWMDLFHSLDSNKDGIVTREEAQGRVDFLARYDDIDTNRDGKITQKEMENYLRQRYGLAAAQ